MTQEPAADIVTNAIYQQIKRGIQVCLDARCYGSALILIYSAIDAMAYLGMPVGRDEVRAADFIEWSDKYIPFCKSRSITGDELYSARCAIVHTYSIDSRRTRLGACRMVGYADQMEPPVRYNPAIDKNLVIVSISALAKGLFDAMDQYLVTLFADQHLRPIAEQRLERLYMVFMVAPEPGGQHE